MLDVTTVIISVLIIEFVSFASLVALYFSRLEVRGPQWWALARLCIFIGLGLTALRCVIHGGFSIVAGNSLLFIGMILMFGGMREFLGRPRFAGAWFRLVLWATGFVVFILGWFSMVEPMLWPRTAAITALVGMISLLTAKELYQKAERSLSKSIAGIVYFTYFLFMSVFCVSTLWLQPVGPSLTEAPPHPVIYLMVMMYSLLFTFCMVLMVSQELHDRLTRQATMDPLTMTYNRRALQMFGEPCFAHMQRSEETIAVLMLDLDYFKKVNDRMGHVVGDELLIHFAGLVRDIIRADDMFFRYGGEEFVVLMPSSNTEGASSLAERIRIACQQTPLAARSGEVKFTVSIGLSLSCAADRNIYDVIKAADEAMYRAKSLGRNRVETCLVRSPGGV